ncbi:MAG TPA: hypothetical protein VJU86_21600 [Pyrinomonadaceae bacterium]|nr:hypothetical protein [Pyrinomonadaceae bacterium]
MKKDTKKQQLSYGELLHLDAIITLAQEQGVRFDEKVQVQSDLCCCGAIVTAIRGKFVFDVRDQEIVNQISKLDRQIGSAPTLQRLIELRGELLRKRNA